jgi:predicted anti-sigma-YlaC factor YlaD
LQRCSEEESLLIGSHLTQCKECRRVLAEEAWLAQKLETMPQAEPSRDLWPAIAGALESERPATAPLPVVLTLKRRWWMVTLAAAASAVLYLSSISFHKPTTPELTLDDVAWVTPSVKLVTEESPTHMAAYALPISQTIDSTTSNTTE